LRRTYKMSLTDLKNPTSNSFGGFKNLPQLPLASAAAAALYGALWIFEGGKADSAAVMWFFAAALFAPYFSTKFAHESYRSLSARVCGVCILLCSAVFSYFGYTNMALGAAFLAPVAFFGNFKVTAYAAIPVFIWTAALPNSQYLHFLISYPLRVLGAHISALTLGLAGFDAVASDTIVSLNGKEIAITAACSGIDQLESMLLLGWLVVLYAHKTLSARLLHFAMILPLIILFNSLRLAVTLAGAERFGDIFLSDAVHSGLGLAMVVCVIVSFMGLSKLFTKGQ